MQVGEYDLAGFAVGAVKKDKLIDGKSIKAGDVVLAFKSSGETNSSLHLLLFLTKPVRHSSHRSGAQLELVVCTYTACRCPLQRVFIGAQGAGGVRDQADRQVSLECTAKHWGGKRMQGGRGRHAAWVVCMMPRTGLSNHMRDSG
jgi:hypothetical protein